MNFVNLFLKCGTYNKSQFYGQILKVELLLLENSFSFSYAELTLNKVMRDRKISPKVQKQIQDNPFRFVTCNPL
ncbi:hypothetical protein LEP1GSC036_3858 [Leptospira weilii str. 2006001853]|uniref:Uncharacterized protein n=2 Tax=Leptospira weilii TaxID=28184 RepID=A0A828Z2R6_9LEPT|nr:hypothetical protein LEP1GSC036_3858 [Leptospira weilii str. 2006001853]EMM72732.1 hypothetical protein LEP1GSC038_1919 [Leptospira weilii str. 2006001855]